MKRRYCTHVMCRPCMQQSATSSVSVMLVSWEDVCRWAHHPVLSTNSGFSNTITRQRRFTTTGVADVVVVPMKTAIIIFCIFIFIFFSMYLVLFSIILYRAIVTVYTDNIFLYNYPRQMRQIIHLSSVGCFTPAWRKTVQKNCEVSRVKGIIDLNLRQ